MTTTILSGDCRELLKTLPDRSVQMCLTSPPYFGLRDYGTATWSGGDPGCDHGAAYRVKRNEGRQAGVNGGSPGSERDPPKSSCKCGAKRIDQQIGLERTPDEFVAELVGVFREVKRVLRDDGCVFLNLGDSYANDTKWGGNSSGKHVAALHGDTGIGRGKKHTGLKAKDLIGIPWRVAFALQADGWYLRCDIIWSKANPMPESVTDRPTKAHEYVFLLTKKDRYFWDAEAVKEEAGSRPLSSWDKRKATEPVRRGDPGISGHVTSTATLASQEGRNLRSVWTIATQPFSGKSLGHVEHFAVMPAELAERCIKAGSSERGCCPACGAPWKRMTETEYKRHEKWFGDKQGARHSRGKAGTGYNEPISKRTTGWKPTCKCADHIPIPCTVLDPFSGAATTLLVADRLGRNAIGIDLNPQYKTMGRNRIIDDAPLFAAIAD